MSSLPVSKLYRSVIDDVITNVRDDFLDDGVDEQVLHELKLTWERKLTESKAIDINAKETEQVVVTKPANSKSSNSLRNSARENKEQQQNQQQNHQPSNQQQQQHHPQPTQSQVQQLHSQQTIQLGNQHVINQTVGSSASISHPQLSGINVAGHPGIIINNFGSNDTDGQKSLGAAVPQKQIVFLQNVGLPGQNVVMASTPGGTISLTPEILNQIALQQSVITHAQPTVVHHTSNVAQNAISGTIQYANSSHRQTPPQTNPRPSQQPNNNTIVQLDGADDSSEEDDEEDVYRDNDDDHDDNDEEVNDEENEGQGEDEDPLNSEDDVSDEEANELFDTDNVVVCQYDKITRSRNKWKFHLKDGIMNLQGRDYVFQRCIGDAEW